VSTLAESVDNSAAKRIIEGEWNQVRSDDSGEVNYLKDRSIAGTISEVLNASQLTYKYILVTNVIAKAVNPAIHYRAMQAQWDNPGAYNARSLGHQVIVEWEKEHGERLGGSNEPFLNKPARYPAFSMENSHRSEQAHKRLYELLERLEEKTNSGEIDPEDVVRQTLYEISQLEPQTIDFEPPKSEVPYSSVQKTVREFIEKSGGGERLASVTAGVMETEYTNRSGEYTVEAEHANVPDEFSNAAGDVEVFYDEELIRAIEVKDKPTERSDLQHAITKARENKLAEYLYVVGQGFKNETERQAAIDEVDETNVEIILVYPDDLLSILKFSEREGRKRFVTAVGEFLNEMRAAEENKTAWKKAVESFD